MDKFEKVFFNLLSTEQGFYMKDYYSRYSNTNKWIGILDLGEAIYAVIVTKESEEAINFNEAKEFLSEAFNKPHSLNSVIITEDDYVEIDGISSENKIIFSLAKRKVVNCSESCRPLEKIIDNIVEMDTNVKDSITKYKTTYILIGINILIYLITIIKSRSLFEIDIYTLINMGAKVNILIDEGQWWRLITAAFLHGGLVHILFNMIALKSIGVQVEKIYGWKKYLMIYFTAALGGSILSYIFSPKSISVGASGAVFGLLGAMLTFGIIKKDIIGKSFMFNIIQVIVLNIVIGLTVPNIDNWGHIGGLILGSLMAKLLFKQKQNVEIIN